MRRARNPVQITFSAPAALLALVFALVFALGCAAPPGQERPIGKLSTRPIGDGNLAVDNVQECGDSLDEAEDRSRSLALRTALNEFGGSRISGSIRRELSADPGRFVEPTAIYNTREQGGRYCPLYSFRVNLDEIERVIQTAHRATQEQVIPTLGVAVSVCSLPPRYEGDREGLTAALNGHLREQLFELGFETEMSGDRLAAETREGCDDMGVRDAFVRDPLRATNYLVYGRADMSEGSVYPRDLGGYHADANLSLRFLSVADGVEVVSNLTATGGGRSELAAMRQALERAADRIARTDASHKIIGHWERKLEDGFVYDVLFCQLREPDDWVKTVRDALLAHGSYIGSGAPIVVAGNVRRTWRYRAAPGVFTQPGPDFHYFLEELQKSRGGDVPGLDEVAVGPRILGGRVYTLFGDDLDICFDDPSRMRSID